MLTTVRWSLGVYHLRGKKIERGTKRPKLVRFSLLNIGDWFTVAIIVNGWSPVALTVKTFESVENTEISAVRAP